MAFQLTSPAFAEGDLIPRRHTDRGENLSPALLLEGLLPEAVSVAITMDDISHPLFGIYNHWLIWNLPPWPEIPEGLPPGEKLPAFQDAQQGLSYGRHRYRGPRPPLRWKHHYRFTVYVLDTLLTLPSSARKAELLSALEGHILQLATLTGVYQNK